MAELLHQMVRGLRTFQMYPANNPMYERGEQAIRDAFAPVWQALERVELRVTDHELLLEEEVVYRQTARAESLAWTLYKDGIRALTLLPGCEAEEVFRFLRVVNAARALGADASDDLLTLLWGEEFAQLEYRFVEGFGEDGPAFFAAPGEATGAGGLMVPPAEQGARVRADAGTTSQPALASGSLAAPPGMVNVESFESTLYFLEESEQQYIRDALAEEYRSDVRAQALDVLYDIFELQPDAAVRDEVLAHLHQLFPTLLTQRLFATAAGMLTTTRELLARVEGLTPEHQRQLAEFEEAMSRPELVAQLLDALEEEGERARGSQLGTLLRALRGSALGPLLARAATLRGAAAQQLATEAIDGLAERYPAEVVTLLRTAHGPALLQAVALAGRLQVTAAVPPLGELLQRDEAPIRAAAAQALAQLGSTGALTYLERALDDSDRTVRLAALRAVAAKGYKNALRRLEPVVQGRSSRELDLTEQMAYFEAYAEIAGAAALPVLEPILLPRGLARLRVSSERRACAAIGIGRIRGAEARAVLEEASSEKDAVVRNAVMRALRERP